MWWVRCWPLLPRFFLSLPLSLPLSLSLRLSLSLVSSLPPLCRYRLSPSLSLRAVSLALYFFIALSCYVKRPTRTCIRVLLLGAECSGLMLDFKY